MGDYSLDQAQRLVDQLAPRDQALLLAYLASRVVQMVPATQPARTESPAAEDAWDAFFQLGDGLTVGDPSDSETLTQAVLAMRR